MEARTLKSLGHTSIIGVIDQGFGDPVTQARPYLILEYFAGQTLDQVGRLALPDFFAIARRVAEAVHAAHSRPRPIYHRDLKPSNIMVLRNADGTWTVKVIDFGLAVRPAIARAGQAVPPANRSTKDKSVTGTLKYAPPEQTGELPDVQIGPYSDVYAFGKTCLDVLFGHTQPDDEEWCELPEPYRGALKKLLSHCVRFAVTGKFPRPDGFEPVLKALNELGPSAPQAPKVDSLTKRPEPEDMPFAKLLEVTNIPPASPPPVETAAQKLRRYRVEAGAKNDKARALVGRHDFAGAVQVLEGFSPEQLHHRDAALLVDATARRDRLAALDRDIHSLLDRHLVHHPRLPVLLAESLELKPDNAEWRELAGELPQPEEPPANPQPGQIFTARAWIPEPDHRPGELLVLKAMISAPKHTPGELISLSWKAVPKRPNTNT